MENLMIPKSEARDLGVFVSCDGSFNEHINKICSKVKQRSGWILRSFTNRTPSFMKWVWSVYVQPIIDYSSQLWAPISGAKLLRLENLLRSFTSKIEGYKSYSYWDRLKLLDISSIERRFERYRTIYSYKILRGWADNCGLKWYHNSKVGTMMKTIAVGKFSKTLRANSFQYLGPRLFNSLPRNLRDSTDEFCTWKNKYNELLRKIPDTPQTAELTPEVCDRFTAAPSNSMLNWIPYLGLDDRRGEKS